MRLRGTEDCASDSMDTATRTGALRSSLPSSRIRMGTVRCCACSAATASALPAGAYATDLRARPGARHPPHRPPCRPRPARIHGRPPPTLVGWRRKQVGGEMRAARLGGHGAWEFGLGAGSAALDGAAAVSTSLQHQSLARAGRRGLLAPAAPLTAWLRTPVSRSFPVGCLFSYLERGPPHGLSQAPLTPELQCFSKLTVRLK